MPNLTITNLHFRPVELTDLYVTLGVGEVKVVYRAWSDVSRMRALQREEQAERIKVTYQNTADELESQLITPPSPYLPIVVDLLGQTVTKIVDSDTGSDETGIGTATRPFKTIPAGLAALSTMFANGSQKLKLQGTAPHIVPDNYVLPAFFSNDAIRYVPNYTDARGFIFTGPLMIEADPILVRTLNPADIVSITGTPVKNITTNLSLTVDELKDCWIVDSSGFDRPARIVGNTSTVIETTYVYNFGPVAPFRIYREGATVQTAAPVVFTAVMKVQGSGCAVLLSGIKLLGSIPDFMVSLELNDGARARCQACNLVGGRFANVTNLYPASKSTAALGGCSVSGIEYMVLSDTTTDDVFYDAVDFNLRLDHCSDSYASFIADGCSPIGTTELFGSPYALSVFVGIIRNGTGHGISIADLGAFTFFDGVVINDCAGDAVHLENMLQFGSDGPNGGITGTGNAGYGLFAKNGANAKINGAVTPHGALGDLKVDTLAPISWPTFRTGPAPYNRTDTTTFTRVHQDS